MNLTNLKLGALLCGIGSAMVERDLSFGAALDGYSSDEIRNEIADKLDYRISDEELTALAKMTEEEVIAEITNFDSFAP